MGWTAYPCRYILADRVAYWRLSFIHALDCMQLPTILTCRQTGVGKVHAEWRTMFAFTSLHVGCLWVWKHRCVYNVLASARCANPVLYPLHCVSLKWSPTSVNAMHACISFLPFSQKYHFLWFSYAINTRHSLLKCVLLDLLWSMPAPKELLSCVTVYLCTVPKGYRRSGCKRQCGKQFKWWVRISRSRSDLQPKLVCWRPLDQLIRHSAAVIR